MGIRECPGESTGFCGTQPRRYDCDVATLADRTTDRKIREHNRRTACHPGQTKVVSLTPQGQTHTTIDDWILGNSPEACLLRAGIANASGR